MIEVVTDRKLITKYQKQFIQRLKTVCSTKILCNIGFQGDSFSSHVFYSTKFDFWFASHVHENRYWNGFGIGRPIEGKNTSISVEINFPYEGINRNMGGSFGHNNNEALLLHRGKIGGGKKGVGKQLFFENFRGDFVTANDDGIDTEFFVIGSINSKLFPSQISNFIMEVHRIKNLGAEKSNDFSALLAYNYTAEHSGTSKIKKINTTIIERTHGIVVNSLATILEEDGYSIGNDRNRDLFIHKNGKINLLFEIKTSSSTQDLYSAVGQLLIYSIPIKTKVSLCLVLPEKLHKTVENRLEELGLKIIYYSWKKNLPIFKKLNQFI